MLKFGKFLKKIETEVIIARNVFHTEKFEKNRFDKELAVIFVNEEFAKLNGFKEGQIIRVSTKDRAVNLKIKINDDAYKPTIPNSIYSNFLTDFDSFKKFKAILEFTDLPPTEPAEIIDLVKTYSL
jgi:formylmethanofuran dehydrogenase subunit D